MVMRAHANKKLMIYSRAIIETGPSNIAIAGMLLAVSCGAFGPVMIV
jgi:hypothetical protein